MLEFLQTIRFVQNFFAFLYKLTRQLSRRKETAKSAEDFLGIWTANICQRCDIRTLNDGIRGMVEISRHYADDEQKQEKCRRKIMDTFAVSQPGGGLFYMKISDFYCAECCKNLR